MVAFFVVGHMPRCLTGLNSWCQGGKLQPRPKPCRNLTANHHAHAHHAVCRCADQADLLVHTDIAGMRFNKSGSRTSHKERALAMEILQRCRRRRQAIYHANILQ